MQWILCITSECNNYIVEYLICDDFPNTGINTHSSSMHDGRWHGRQVMMWWMEAGRWMELDIEWTICDAMWSGAHEYRCAPDVMYQHYRYILYIIICSWRCNGLELCSRRICLFFGYTSAWTKAMAIYTTIVQGRKKTNFWFQMCHLKGPFRKYGCMLTLFPSLINSLPHRFTCNYTAVYRYESIILLVCMFSIALLMIFTVLYNLQSSPTPPPTIIQSVWEFHQEYALLVSHAQ